MIKEFFKVDEQWGESKWARPLGILILLGLFIGGLLWMKMKN